MTVAFDPQNLDGAVAAVMDEAAHQGLDSLLNMRAESVDLTSPDQVRTYLKDFVLASYEKAKSSPEGVQIARIEGMPYRGIGFVYESHENVIMHPPPEGVEAGEDVHHLAYFWENLSR